MIRVGSTPLSVFSTRLNSFHSQAVAESGFYVNVEGDSPPPVLTSPFASQYTAAPWLRRGGTIFVDPYRFSVVPVTVSTFYFEIEVAQIGFNLRWANSYSGEANAIVPPGPRVNIVSANTGDSVYVRVNNKGKNYRLFTFNNMGSETTVVLIGPENSRFITPEDSGTAYLHLLGGINTPLFFADMSGGNSRIVLTKQDDTGYLGTMDLFTERSLSGSLTGVSPTLTFWVFK